LYRSESKERPAALSEKPERLSGSARQNWCLLQFIPLLIYDLVNCLDEIYQLIMLLRSIVELVLAPVLSVGQISHMKVMIGDYLNKRKKCFLTFVCGLSITIFFTTHGLCFSLAPLCGSKANTNILSDVCAIPTILLM